VRSLNRIYREEPALSVLDDTPEGFEWIDFHDADNTVWSFLRKSPAGVGHDLIAVVNATPVVRRGYRIGVPVAGDYTEILNSDAVAYGGGGVINGNLTAEHHAVHGRPFSLVVDLPPLAVMMIRVPRS
jgi:1,4-alpha-glucan branching enzyme